MSKSEAHIKEEPAGKPRPYELFSPIYRDFQRAVHFLFL